MIKMDTLNLFELLKQVISSWQVIVITIALVLYLNIVFYVSRKHHRPRAIHKLSVKKKKSKPEETETFEDENISSDDDELGLEEE